VLQPLQNVCNSGQRLRVGYRVTFTCRKSTQSRFFWFLAHKYNNPLHHWILGKISLFDGFLIAHGDGVHRDMWYASQSFELGQILSKKLVYPWLCGSWDSLITASGPAMSREKSSLTGVPSFGYPSGILRCSLSCSALLWKFWCSARSRVLWGFSFLSERVISYSYCITKSQDVLPSESLARDSAIGDKSGSSLLVDPRRWVSCRDARPHCSVADTSKWNLTHRWSN